MSGPNAQGEHGHGGGDPSQQAYLSSVSVSSVHKLVHKELGFTLKAAQVKNVRRMSPAAQARYREFVMRHFRGVDASVFGNCAREKKDMPRWIPRFSADRFLFTDESGFNLQNTRRPRGWAPRGQPLYIEGCIDRGPIHTLVVAVSATGGVVARAWQRSAGIKGGGFVRDRFIDFLSGPFARGVRRHRRTLPARRRDETLFLVMDNAPVHMGPRVRDALHRIGVEPVYLPPYSPELNPCEMVFSQVKRGLRSAHEIVCVARAPVRFTAGGNNNNNSNNNSNNNNNNNKTNSKGKNQTRKPKGRSDQTVRSAWLRSRVMARLDSVSAENVAGYYRACAWGNKY